MTEYSSNQPVKKEWTEKSEEETREGYPDGEE